MNLRCLFSHDLINVGFLRFSEFPLDAMYYKCARCKRTFIKAIATGGELEEISVRKDPINLLITSRAPKNTDSCKSYWWYDHENKIMYRWTGNCYERD